MIFYLQRSSRVFPRPVTAASGANGADSSGGRWFKRRTKTMTRKGTPAPAPWKSISKTNVCFNCVRQFVCVWRLLYHDLYAQLNFDWLVDNCVPTLRHATQHVIQEKRTFCDKIGSKCKNYPSANFVTERKFDQENSSTFKSVFFLKNLIKQCNITVSVFYNRK